MLAWAWVEDIGEELDGGDKRASTSARHRRQLAIARDRAHVLRENAAVLTVVLVDGLVRLGVVEDSGDLRRGAAAEDEKTVDGNDVLVIPADPPA